jgi:hypothetical protein
MLFSILVFARKGVRSDANPASTSSRERYTGSPSW